MLSRLSAVVGLVMCVAVQPGELAKADSYTDCSTNQLSLEVVGNQGAAGTWITHYKVKASLPCTIEGFFSFAGYTSSGEQLFRHERHQGEPKTVLLSAGHFGYFRAWGRETNNDGRLCPVAVNVRAKPPSSHSSLRLRKQHIPNCEGDIPTVSAVTDNAN